MSFAMWRRLVELRVIMWLVKFHVVWCLLPDAVKDWAERTAHRPNRPEELA